MIWIAGGRAEDVAAGLKATAATAKNASCGKDELDGVMYETVCSGLFEPEIQERAPRDLLGQSGDGVGRQVDQPRRGSQGSKYLVTQIIEPAPDLQLAARPSEHGPPAQTIGAP